MDYKFQVIESRWQQHWKDTNVYRVSTDTALPKCYVLDMFPYPSGAGLHVGHPLGYIASDIYSRYKRLKGFNVLHPMGFDAFGLPAEQYALENGVHPATSTAANIANFKNQLAKIGFCYDWEREVNTSEPQYYRWTQWIFLQLFHSYFNRQTQKADKLDHLVTIFNNSGNEAHPFPNDKFLLPNGRRTFSAAEWKAMNEKAQADVLMEYRLSYCAYGEVNWCEALGTVLANDEVVNGVSERGGHPVVKKKLRQWYLRITEYAGRLEKDLQKLDWTDAMKEMQTNWIGKSSGAEIVFAVTAPETQPHPRSQPHPRPLWDRPLSQGEGINEGAVDTSAEDFGEREGYDDLMMAAEPHGFYQSTKEQWERTQRFARDNRKRPTEAEEIVWELVRNRHIEGYKFRRQYPIAGFLPDFVCLEKQLIVEVDGGYHSAEDQQQYDQHRSDWLAEHGYELVRVTNEEVLADRYGVRQKIEAALAARPTFSHGNIIHAKEAASDYQTNPLSHSSPLLGRGVALKEGGGEVAEVRVYTTRPDTIFGVDFMVIAPEHELVSKITTAGQAAAVEEYVAWVNSRSERERMAEKKISGAFTGAYAINPFDGRQIPIWISEYVLAGYGTGAIMGVPCGDERDHRFARHFNLPITNIIGEAYNGEDANPTKEAILQNSGFLTGVRMKEAMELAIRAIEERGIGTRKINYRLRDAAFSRQRYWGEPFPIVWENGIARALPEEELPLTLPVVEKYSAGPEGEGPLANLPEWTERHLETNTMPGYAGSSWYFLRYADPQNNETFAGRRATDYWNQVDVYVGGTEHAVGHLLYSRMWTKVLHDLGHIGFDEPFKRLVNQGMIQGSSRFVHRLTGTQTFISAGLLDAEGKYQGQTTDELHVDVNFVDGLALDTTLFRQWRNGEYANAEFVLENGQYLCSAEVEKMSKSKFNTVNPDDLVNKYGADTFRMYEMFLGPIEQSKPWDTKGIEGVHRFLRKCWRLFYTETGPRFDNSDATPAQLRTLHKTIKKIGEDTERFSFNTAVAAFMVCVNELTEQNTTSIEVLEPLCVLLAPYAPHLAEELYQAIRPAADNNNGQEISVLNASWPALDESLIAESDKEYPVSINGKMRATIKLPLSAEPSEAEAAVLANDVIQKWMEGKPLKKFIYVKGKAINVVV